MKRWTEAALYLAVGFASLGLALFVSSQWVGKTIAQDQPTKAPQSPPATSPPEGGATPTGPAPEGSQESENSEVISGKDLPFIEPYRYDAKDRRDPFQAFSNDGRLAEGAAAGPLLPLQRFDLDELELIGIMWDIKAPKALFLDPAKTVHTVAREERIGRKNGYIAVIREGEVVVVEAEKLRGELVYTTRVLKMDR